VVRVVFAGEMSREICFVGHFRTSAGRRATQKSSDGLSTAEVGLASAQPLTWGRGKRKGWITCIHLREDTISKVKQASSLKSAKHAMKIHTLEPAH